VSLHPHWTQHRLVDVRVQVAQHSLVADVQLRRRRAGEPTRTGLTAGSPGEAVCVAMKLARAMDDLKVVFAKSLEPPGELSLRLLHPC
jgi:hypothetical protein